MALDTDTLKACVHILIHEKTWECLLIKWVDVLVSSLYFRTRGCCLVIDTDKGRRMRREVYQDLALFLLSVNGMDGWPL